MIALRFDLEWIGEDQLTGLMQLLAQSDIEECEIEQGDCKVSIKRLSQEDATLVSEEQEAPQDAPTTAAEPAVITAPAVGIFYRSENRSGPPKVDIGDKVKVGDVIGFIRVVNVPHSVHSTCEGIVKHFSVDNGQPVEYGQPIISLQQSAISN